MVWVFFKTISKYFINTLKIDNIQFANLHPYSGDIALVANTKNSRFLLRNQFGFESWLEMRDLFPHL